MMRRLRNSHRRMAGFTLMELLVALILLGLISTMALGGVRLGARTWETVTEKAGDNSHRQVVRSFLARELAQAAPVLAGEPSISRLAYEGDSTSLVFVAPLAPHFGLGGLQRLELAIVDGEADGERQLILKRRPFYRDDPLDAEPDSEEEEIHLLLDGISEAEFAYRESARDGASAWSSEWRDREELPALVRLRVVFADSRSAAWPDLLVGRRITTLPGCLPAEAQRGCGKR